MKKKNQLIIAIVSVFLIIVVVAGSTYSYLTWVSNTTHRTIINFAIADSTQDMYANLEGGGSATAQNLAPVTCASSNYGTYGLKRTMTLKYKNNTAQAASIKGTLTITAWTPAHGTISSEALGKINYRVTESGTNCSQTAVTGMSGTFPSTITAGSTKLINNVQFLSAPANTTTEQTKTYYLWIWIDSTYAHENVGNVISDPLQDLQFTVQWSGTMSNA